MRVTRVKWEKSGGVLRDASKIWCASGEESRFSAHKARGEEAVLASLGMTFTGRTAKNRLAAEELFEEEAGEAAGVVAEDAVFLEEIVEDDAEAKFLELGKIDGHRFGALSAVTPRHIGRYGLAIGDDPIDDAARNVFLDGAEMIAEGVAGSFSGLGHQIGNVNARSLGLGDGAGDFRD